jgi:polar amino acid transport system substrate-binding protein
VWQPTDERRHAFDFSEPVIDSGTVFFHRRDMPFRWRQIDDLKRYRIGVTNGYFYGNAFGEAVRRGELRVEVVASDELNFRKLQQGRIDLFPSNRTAGMALLDRLFAAEQARQIVADLHMLNSQPLGLMLNRMNPENARLMEDFNRGLRKLRASGELDRMLRAAGQATMLPKTQAAAR